MIFKKFPLFFLFLGTIWGSIYFYYFPISIPYLYFIVVALVSVLFFAYFLQEFVVATLVAIALFWIIGGLWTEIFIPPLLSDYIGKSVIAYGKVLTKLDGRKAVFFLRWIRCRNRFRDINSKVLLYLPGKGKVSAGDFLLVRGKFDIFRHPPTPYQFDFRRYYWGKKVFFLIYPYSKENIVQTGKDREGFIKYIRQRVSMNVRSFLPQKAASFVLAITVGIKRKLSYAELKPFYNLGLGHVLAISGLHVGVIVSVVLFATAFLFVPITVRISISAVFLFFYLLLVGFRPSVFRAVSMAVVFLIGWWFGGYNGINTLGFAGLLFFIFNPFAWMDTGFVLSFTVTFFLLYITPIQKAKGYFYEILRIFVIAQISSIPLTLYFFNQINLFSIVANAIIVPIVSLVILPFSLLAELTSFLSHFLANFFFFIVKASTYLMFDMVNFLNKLTESFIFYMPAFSVWIVVISYISFVFAGIYLRTRRSCWMWSSFVVFVLSIGLFISELGTLRIVHIARGGMFETVVSLPFKKRAYLITNRGKSDEYLILKLGKPPVKKVENLYLSNDKISVDASSRGSVKINGKLMPAGSWAIKIRRGVLW